MMTSDSTVEENGRKDLSGKLTRKRGTERRRGRRNNQ